MRTSNDRHQRLRDADRRALPGHLARGSRRRSVRTPLPHHAEQRRPHDRRRRGGGPIHIIESVRPRVSWGRKRWPAASGWQAHHVRHGRHDGEASIVEDGEVPGREYQLGGGIMHGPRLLTGAGYLLVCPPSTGRVARAVARSSGSIRWRASSWPAERRSAAGPSVRHGGTEPTITDANVILGYLARRAWRRPVKLNAGARARRSSRTMVARRIGCRWSRRRMART